MNTPPSTEEANVEKVVTWHILHPCHRNYPDDLRSFCGLDQKNQDGFSGLGHVFRVSSYRRTGNSTLHNLRLCLDCVRIAGEELAAVSSEWHVHEWAEYDDPGTMDERRTPVKCSCGVLGERWEDGSVDWPVT